MVKRILPKDRTRVRFVTRSNKIMKTNKSPFIIFWGLDSLLALKVAESLNISVTLLIFKSYFLMKKLL